MILGQSGQTFAIPASVNSVYEGGDTGDSTARTVSIAGGSSATTASICGLMASLGGSIGPNVQVDGDTSTLATLNSLQLGSGSSLGALHLVSPFSALTAPTDLTLSNSPITMGQAAVSVTPGACIGDCSGSSEDVSINLVAGSSCLRRLGMLTFCAAF